MRVLAADVLVGHIEHQKITLYLERHVPLHFSVGQTATEILHQRQMTNGYVSETGCLLIRQCRDDRRRHALWCRVDVTDNARGIPNHLRMRGYVMGDHGTSADHCALSNSDTREDGRV